MTSIYDFTVKTRDGQDFPLKQLQGKVLLIVNTATGCGFTPQYAGLEKLYETYHQDGLEILDFPCNQFGHQAPGTDAEIHEFCTAKYDTQFDQFAKIEVIGDKADPLYQFLVKEQPNEEVKGAKNKLAMKAIDKITRGKEPGMVRWNFTKFLVDKTGKVVARFDPTRDPLDLEPEIQKLLK